MNVDKYLWKVSTGEIVSDYQGSYCKHNIENYENNIIISNIQDKSEMLEICTKHNIQILDILKDAILNNLTN